MNATCPRHRLASAALPVALALSAATLAAPARAADDNWTNPAGGSFADAANWSLAAPPADADTAVFGLNAAYTVGFPGDFTADFSVTNAAARFDAGTVTLDLNRSQGLTDYNLTGAAVVGGVAGQTARLAVIDGSVSADTLAVGGAGVGVLTLNNSSFGAQFTVNTSAAIGAGSAGTVNLGNLDATTDPGNGYLQVGGPIYVGGGAGGAGSAGTLNVGRGGTVRAQFSAAGVLTLYAPGTVNLNRGGTLDVFQLDAQGGTINFNGGNLSIAASDLTVGAGGPINANLTLGSDNMVGNDSLTLSSSRVLTLNGRTVTLNDGGLLDVGSIVSTGGGVFYNGGSFNLTNSGLVLDARSDARPLGDSITVGPSSAFRVGGTLTVGETGAGSFAVQDSQLGTSYSDSLAIAASAGSTGTVTVGGGASGAGSFQVANGNAYVGGDASGAGGTATLDVSTGGYFSVSGDLVLYAGGSVTLDGTFFNANRLDDRGGTFTYVHGSLNVNDSITIGGGAALDQDVTLVSGDSLASSGPIIVDGRTVTLAGGQFAAATLTNPNGGFVDFQAGSLTINQGDLTLTAGGPVGASLTLDSTKSLSVNATGNFTATVTVAADGALAVTGGSLSAAQLVNNSAAPVTFTGGTVVLSSKLVIDALGPDRPFGATLTLDAGQYLGPQNLTVGQDGAGALSVTGNSQVVANNNAFAVAAGAGSVGTVDIGTDGTSGVVQAASLYVGGDAAGAGGTATVNVGSGGQFNTYQFVAGILTIYAGGTVNLDGGSLSVRDIDRRGGGTLNFNSGSINLFGSDLTLDAAGPLGASVDLTSDRSLRVGGLTTVAAGSTLAVNGGSFTTGTLDARGSLTFNGGSLTVQSGGLTVDSGGLLTARVDVAAGSSLSFGGNLVVGDTNAGVVNIAEGGSVSAYDTYVAAQPGSTGRLVVDGSLNSQFGSSGPIVVGGRADPADTDPSDGLTILPGGDGTLAGGGNLNATLYNLGIVAGGGEGKAGRLSVGGAYFQQATGELQIELGGLGFGESDLLSVGGFSNVNNSNVGVTLDGLLSVSFLDGFTSSLDDAFQIIQTRGFTGVLAGEFAGLPDGGTLAVGPRLFQIAYADAGVTLTDIGSVPEPTALGLLGLIGLTLRRRRRR